MPQIAEFVAMRAAMSALALPRVSFNRLVILRRSGPAAPA